MAASADCKCYIHKSIAQHTFADICNHSRQPSISGLNPDATWEACLSVFVLGHFNTGTSQHSYPIGKGAALYIMTILNMETAFASHTLQPQHYASSAANLMGLTALDILFVNRRV